MNTMKCLLICSALAGSLLAVAAPKHQTEAGRDLIDTAMSVHQFDTFLMLLRDADLIFNLKDGGPFTIFAPTDEAFKSMPEGLLDQIHEDQSRLRQFLLHHIVRGSWSVEQAVKARSLTALDGSVLLTRDVNGHGRVGNASFVIGNMRTSNGIMHGIDSMLMPK